MYKFSHLIKKEDPKNSMHEQLVNIESKTHRNTFLNIRLSFSTLEHSIITRIKDIMNSSPKKCNIKESF